MRRLRSAFACAAALAALLPGPARSDEPVLYAFEGGMHAHTGYSDGARNPAVAYRFARDDSKMDFYAVTDHAESTLPPSVASGLTPDGLLDEWESTRLQAGAETTGAFTAIRGFEWTSTFFGHVGVYFSSHFTATTNDGGDATIEPFYAWLRLPAALGGGDDGLAVFNHPGYPARPSIDPRARWNGYQYRPELDRNIVGIELWNGWNSLTGPFNYDRDLVAALDAGWHLAPVGAEDTHSADWGDAKYAKTVLVAGGRSAADLKDAMAARRMYAVLRPGTRLTFTAGGRPMGSRIAASGPVPLSATVESPSVAAVELVTKGGVVFARREGAAVDATAEPGPTERYYFARAVDATGRPLAYSAPVWLSQG